MKKFWMGEILVENIFSNALIFQNKNIYIYNCTNLSFPQNSLLL